MLKKVLSLSLAVLLSAGIFAGCSSSQGTTAPTGDKQQAGNQVKTITMWTSWGGDGQKQIEQQVKAFNDSHKDIQVKLVVQQNLEQKLLTSLAGGEVPDVMLWDRFQTALYAPKGALYAIDDFVKKDNINLGDYYEEAVKEMSYKGKLYGMPLLVDNRSLFYNKKIFAEAGVNPPKTWAELEEVAKKLTVWKDGKLVRSGFPVNDVGLFNMWILQAGGTMLTADGQKVNFNSKAGLDVLNFWDKLVNVDKVYVNGFTQGLAQGEDPFVTGKVAMTFNGPWSLADYKKYGKDLDFGIVPPPAGPNGDKGAMMGGFGLAICGKAKNPNEAWEFVKWWANEPKNGIDFAKISGWIPANKKATADSYFTNDPYYKAFVETMGFAKIRPAVSGYSDVEGKATIPNFQLFMSGKMKADEALKDAEVKGNKILEENRQ